MNPTPAAETTKSKQGIIFGNSQLYISASGSFGLLSCGNWAHYLSIARVEENTKLENGLVCA